jgi:aminoglycoside phosphotransferase (APT) family kinase protein
VSRVGEGWDNEVYLVDGWIFRFPRHTDQIAWQEREIALMPVVVRALGPLAPAFEKIGEPSAAFPYAFVGYRVIDGIAANEARDIDLDVLARDIGRAYTRIHAIDPAAISRTPAGWEDESWHDWRPHHADDLDELRGALPASVANDAEPFLQASIEPPPDGPKRVVHNDICADHVLVDPASGHLRGIIDWADMMVGDPVLDFVGLISIGGYGFIDRVLAHYDGPLDALFRERLDWATRTQTLHWLVDALDEDEPPHKHVLWVERAFEQAP